MPGPRLPMRKIRDVLRLSAAGMSKRKIAASLGVSATAAGGCIRRARRAGLDWPLPEGLTNETLELQLYPPGVAAKDGRPRPDWAAIHRELRRAGVTLQLLWEEHRAVHPDGYGYSRYCELYRAWEARLSPTMRQSHVAGERMFVDYAGTTLEVIDASTGEARTAQLFVAALGASSYTYAEATWTQSLSDWIGLHTRTFAFIGGVTAMVVSDNLRSGITKACFYEPAVNRQAAQPTVLLAVCIERGHRRTGRTDQQSRVAPSGREPSRAVLGSGTVGSSSRCRPSPTSSPNGRNAGSGSTTTSRSRSTTTRCRTSCCARRFGHASRRARSKFSTAASALPRMYARPPTASIRREHMPSSHRRYADWTPERLRRKAGEIGRNTSALVEIILRERSHPEQGFRACVGILRLAKTYGRERLEAACARALDIGARSYSSVNSILKNNLDRRRPAVPADGPAIAHDNIRGPTYFH
jgi:transposase